MLSRKIFFFDDIYRHFFACPKSEGGSPLIEKHVKAVKGPAAVLPGKPEQFGFLRVIDHIGDDQIRAEHGHICDETALRIRAHADGSAVCQNMAGFDSFFQGSPIRQII